MKISKTLLCSSILFCLTACAAHTDKSINLETIKPGAAISLNHSAPKNMQAQQFQTILLMIDEAYNEGRMTFNIVPSEGLRLFGGVDNKSFSMDEVSTHDWPIDVSAEEDGIYFLNVFASVDTEDGLANQNRSFSIRLDIGNITPEMRAIAFPENGTLSDDGKTRILEAKETIQ